MKLKSYIAPVEDLDAAKRLYTALFGAEPVMDTPYYVQYETEGVIFGLDPNAAGKGITEAVGYWDVGDVDGAFKELVDAGATVVQEPADVGGGARTAVVRDTAGNPVGLING